MTTMMETASPGEINEFFARQLERLQLAKAICVRHIDEKTGKGPPFVVFAIATPRQVV